MLAREKKILETFKRCVPNLPEEKQEYLLGLSEKMVAIHERHKSNSKDEEQTKKE